MVDEDIDIEGAYFGTYWVADKLEDIEADYIPYCYCKLGNILGSHAWLGVGDSSFEVEDNSFGVVNTMG